jgi:hypothetical protein
MDDPSRSAEKETSDSAAILIRRVIVEDEDRGVHDDDSDDDVNDDWNADAVVASVMASNSCAAEKRRVLPIIIIFCLLFDVFG